MVPRIARTGHSFKGAGQYYLHDKQAQTKERVMWTETINLPTQDPDKAFNWMAHTSMNANRLKRQAGVPATGRKNLAGDVYSFSLAWHPKQEPDRDTLLQSALETLGLLRLQDHQAVIVAHNDTEHPHVHVVCNLIHPENGKKAVVSYDRLTLSQWAEGVERNEGEILCEQRVINNQKRREQNNKLKLVKHKEPKLEIAPLINELYQQSDSGNTFRAAVEEKGYTLAKGDARGYVLVDERGKIYSLSRQLEGQRSKDVRERLKDVQELPMGKEISEERQSFDRDRYETERQKKIVDAAIEIEQNRKGQKEKPPADKQEYKYTFPQPNEQDEHLRKLDELMAWEQKTDWEKHRLQQEQDEFYKRGTLVKQIEILENKLSGKENLLDKMTKKRVQLQAQLDALKLNLASIEQRIQEQDGALENENQKVKPNPDAKPPPEPENKPEQDLKAHDDYERRMQELRQRKKDKGKDRDNNFER